MRGDVMTWAALALALMAAEALAPGAFMLWMGFAAMVVFVGVALVPGIPLLWQVAAFVDLSFVSIQVYRRWFSNSASPCYSTRLNRRANQHIVVLTPMEQAIVGGRGRIKLCDAFWLVEGPDLPVGTTLRVIAVDGMVLKVQEA